MALIKLVLTAVACVAWITVAGVTGNSIYAGTMVAWVRLTVVDITLTQCAFITWKVAKTGTNVYLCPGSGNAMHQGFNHLLSDNLSLAF